MLVNVESTISAQSVAKAVAEMTKDELTEFFKLVGTELEATEHDPVFQLWDIKKVVSAELDKTRGYK